MDLNFPLLLTSNSESLNILPSFKKKWKHFVGYFWDKFYMDTLHATDKGLLRAVELQASNNDIDVFLAQWLNGTKFY